MLDILPDESILSKFTDTINEQISVVAESGPTLKSDLTVEDFEALNQIINEISEMNETIPTEQSGQATESSSSGLVRSLSRMDSISLALNDFFLQEFDAFESNVQINDPMIGNSQLLVTNPLKIF